MRKSPDYVARCAADHRPVSGRAEFEPSIQPIELYTGAGALSGDMIEVRRRGRGEYVATRISHGSRTEAATAKSRAKIHRKVEGAHPGGEWSCALLSSEVAEIRAAWGLA